MLVLDVLDDWVPAKDISELGHGRYSSPGLPSVVIDLIAIPWSIHNVEPQADPVFLNN